jgi:arginine/ornithine succinyltransferase subunit-like protein
MITTTGTTTLTTPEGDGLRLALAGSSLHLTPRLGLALPRYHFHIGRVVHAAAELGLFRVQTTLLLGNDLTGCAELSDWQAAPGLDAAAQAEAFGALIAAAQAEIARRPADFGDSLVAELPGWREPDGACPFWQGLGAHFYPGDSAAAEARLGPAWRSHLAALLPRQTVYLSFLGEGAQARLAEVAPGAQPMLAALRAAGFQPPSHVRIDDGGPVLAWRQG